MGLQVQRFLMLSESLVSQCGEDDLESIELYVADELARAHPDVRHLTAGWIEYPAVVGEYLLAGYGSWAIVAMGELPPCPQCHDSGRLNEGHGPWCSCLAGHQAYYDSIAALFRPPSEAWVRDELSPPS